MDALILLAGSAGIVYAAINDYLLIEVLCALATIVAMVLTHKWRSRPSVSTVGTLVPTTPDYQAQALRLSFIAQCGLWPLVMTIVFFAWHERTAALCCLGVTFVVVPLATWRIVREFRSRT
jgi:hypothetical protein